MAKKFECEFKAYQETEDATGIVFGFGFMLLVCIGIAIPSPYGDWILYSIIFFCSFLWAPLVFLAIIIIVPIITKIEEIRGKTFEWNK